MTKFLSRSQEMKCLPKHIKKKETKGKCHTTLIHRENQYKANIYEVLTFKKKQQSSRVQNTGIRFSYKNSTIRH